LGVRRSFHRWARAAPRSAVAELGVVSRCLASTQVVTSRISFAFLWLLILASGAAHVLQWRDSRRIEAEALTRFTEERDRSNRFHAHYMTQEAFAERERTELQATVKSLNGTSFDSPLLKALAEDFRHKTEGYMVDIADKCVGTPQEAFGRESALWHATRLEACGLLPSGITAQAYVDGTFRAARK
jgi:hypothetical protein